MSRGRRYGSVQNRLWTLPHFCQLPTQAKLMFLYLLTSEHAHSSGVFRLPTAYASADTGLTLEEINVAHGALEKAGLAIRRHDWIIVPSRLEDDPPANANALKAVMAQINDAVRDAPIELPLPLLWPGIESLQATAQGWKGFDALAELQRYEQVLDRLRGRDAQPDDSD